MGGGLGGGVTEDKSKLKYSTAYGPPGKFCSYQNDYAYDCITYLHHLIAHFGKNTGARMVR